MNLSELFPKSASAKADKNQRLLDTIRNKITMGGNPLENLGGSIFSTEGYERENLVLSIEELTNNLVEAVDETAETEEDKTQYTEQQLEAARLAAVAANARGEVLERLAEEPVVRKGETLVTTTAVGSEPDVGRMEAALEAYDNSELRNTMMLSFAFNLKAARQDEFGEAFFPTVVVSPDVATVTISVDLLNVMEDQKRSIDGTYNYQFGRKSLVKALVYPTILNNDTTRIYPVVRTESEHLFVDKADVAPKTVQIDELHSVDTAPLKFGQAFDLLSLGSADYLIGGGALDFTDQLDSSVQLSSLFLKLKDGSVIEFDHLENLNESSFVHVIQGNDRAMNLNFNTRYMKVDATTTKADGSALTGAVVTNDLTVSLDLSAFGHINVDTAQTRLTAGTVGVVAVHDKQGDKLDLTKGNGKTVVDEFADAELIGYTLIARRINTNRRERGQVLDINRERLVYVLPVLAPISIVRPVQEGDTKDGERLKALVMATYIRCSNAAVETLLSAEEYLASIPPTYDPELLYNSHTLGAARFFVDPVYAPKQLDVLESLNTLRTADRIVDVNAVIVNAIREAVFSAYLKSNYQAAARVLEGENGNKKPRVIIGTDPYIAAYLQFVGDTRILGDQFEFEVVSTTNIKMRGKIICVFGKANPNASDIANPLHFGNMYWRPELTTILPISRNNTISKELTVQPSFKHVINCPVMISIDLVNLPEAVTVMSPIKNKVTP